jgi:two-component system NtrC family sensor kinase
MATLHVLQGPDKGRTLTTQDDVVLIGRGSAQVPLTDQTVSRRHAELRTENGAWLLSDLNSANGTYLNGTRLERAVRLKHGDQIRMGSTLLVYAGDDSLEQISGAGIPADMIQLDAGAGRGGDIVSSVVSNEDSVILAAPDTAYAVKSWKVMRELTSVIGSLVAPEQLMARVMDIVFEEVPAERGVIFMRDEASGELLPEIVRFRDRRARAETSRTAISASRAILEHVMTSREGVLVANVQGDRRFDRGKSEPLGMRSLICAPIVARERILGVLYLDSPVARHTYNEHELRLIAAIGYQTGLAIENTRLVQAHLERERLAATGETVAYLSHAIKNILQGMRSGADLVERGLEKRDFALTTQGWRILDRNMDRVYNLMLNMLAFSKEREPQLEMLQVNKLATDVVELMQRGADDANVVLLCDLDESTPAVPLDHDGMHQVLVNLVANAIDAAPRHSGVVNVRTRYDPVERHVILSVVDNGPGIPEHERAHIWTPFHSTKGHGGTGLGLPVCRKIVHEHRGSIEFVTPDGGGTEFIVRLPTADARRAAAGDTQGPAGR